MLYVCVVDFFFLLLGSFFGEFLSNHQSALKALQNDENCVNVQIFMDLYMESRRLSFIPVLSSHRNVFLKMSILGILCYNWMDIVAREPNTVNSAINYFPIPLEAEWG